MEKRNPMDDLLKNNEIMKELLLKAKVCEDRTKELVSDTKYIKWLEEFTSKHPFFYDDSWLYCPSKLSDDDRKNVEILSLFFRAIDRYAKDNYIALGYVEFGSFYNIKYNNVGYCIGLVVGQGASSYCDRFDISDDDYLIDFNDIMNNKKQVWVDDYNNKLNDLSNLIKSLYDDGLSAQFIECAIKSAFDDILNKDNKNNVVRTLIKD